MEIMLPHLVSLLAVGIIIIVLLLAYVKKVMLTYALIIANLLVFFLTIFFQNEIIGDLGFRSAYLSPELFPQTYTILTSMFVHSGFLHILGNMFVFFFMGIAFEQRIGRKKFLIIYLITGICAALAQTFVKWGSPLLLVGASGAIFGILGAFAFSYPRDEVVMPVPVGIMFIMRIKVMYATILFAALETVVVLFEIKDSTAHFAHLGGLASGVVLAAIIVGKQGEKINNVPGTMSYNSMLIPRDEKINFSHLSKLAKTPELKEMLERVEHESVRQVRDVWLEHFLEKTVCPVCSKPLNHFDRKIWCVDEHFKTDY